LKFHEGSRPGLDDLELVLDTRFDADMKWHKIGLLLGLSDEDLKHIGAKHKLQQKCFHETLSLWLKEVDLLPTWERLVDALENSMVKEYKLAKLVKKIYCNKRKHQVRDEQVKPSDYLRYLYQKLAPRRMLQWPVLPHYKFITLAMIKRRKVVYGKNIDKFVRDTLHGNVDDILREKKEIKLEGIFKKKEAKRKVILIEGAPGAGKTMLVWHICKHWGRKELFHQFSILVLAILRDPTVQKAKSVTDVLSHIFENQRDAQKISSKIEACHGRGILFLLDGWDELPRKERKRDDFFFRTLIEKPHKHSLDEAAIIVTSRPVSSGDLREFASMRIEIVGFSTPNIKEYFKTCLEFEEGHAKEGNLLRAVEDNPLIESICYLPLNAAIVVYLFCACDYALPSTYHELFQLLVYHCIVRYAEKNGVDIGQHQQLSFENFPEEINKPFEQVCKLAYLATKENVLTFSSATLSDFGVTERLNHLGLMQSVTNYLKLGEDRTYHFMHLSLQELLAAYHISKLMPGTQVKVFKEMLHNPRFTAVFGFYAGFTKFKNEGIRDVVSGIIQSERQKPEDKTLLVSLMNWLYEAQDPQLCHFVQGELTRDQSGQQNEGNRVLNLSYTSLKPSDALSVGYFLSTVSTTIGRHFHANLSCCQIEDHHTRFLLKGLSHCQPTMSRASVEMNLSQNNIHAEGLEDIADFLKISTTIKVLNLGRNELSQSNVRPLMEALTKNSSLTELNLSQCSLEFTGEVGKSLRTMLTNNCSLLSLDISYSTISPDYIADGLAQNRGLKTLYMKYCSITAEGTRQISEAIQKSKLEKLSIGPLEDNCIKPLTNALTSLKFLSMRGKKVTDQGMKTLGCALQENNSLLELSLWDFQSITSKGLKILGDQLKWNKKLEVLELRLIGGSTTDGLNDLVKCLQQNSALKSLKLLEKQVAGIKEAVYYINKRRKLPLELETYEHPHRVSYNVI